MTPSRATGARWSSRRSRTRRTTISPTCCRTSANGTTRSRTTIARWRSSRTTFAAHNNLGALLVERADWDKAAAHFEQALRLRARFRRGLRQLWSAAAQKGRSGPRAGIHQARLRRPANAEDQGPAVSVADRPALEAVCASGARRADAGAVGAVGRSAQAARCRAVCSDRAERHRRRVPAAHGTLLAGAADPPRSRSHSPGRARERPAAAMHPGVGPDRRHRDRAVPDRAARRSAGRRGAHRRPQRRTSGVALRARAAVLPQRVCVRDLGRGTRAGRADHRRHRRIARLGPAGPSEMDRGGRILRLAACNRHTPTRCSAARGPRRSMSC